jgi:hypothetical protein
MKIVQRGWPPNVPADELDAWWVGRTAECLECHTVVRLEDEDYVIQRLVFTEYGRESTRIYARCPVCFTEAIALERYP